MTTSGVTTFTVTLADVERMAMLLLGKIGGNEVLTSQETTDLTMLLNMVVKNWQPKADFAPGAKMWKRKHADLFLYSNQNSYALGPSGDKWSATNYQRTLTATANAGASTLTVSGIANATNGDQIGIALDSGNLQWTTISGAPAGSTITLATTLTGKASSGAYVFNYTTAATRPDTLVAVVLRDTSGNDVPVNFMTIEDYEYITSKANSGFTADPLRVYYQPDLTNGTLYLDVYGAADVTKKLHITYLEPIQDFVNSTDNPEFPQRWYLALAWELAKQAAPMFNAPWTQEMQANYAAALSAARELDMDTSTLYFQPGLDG